MRIVKIVIFVVLVATVLLLAGILVFLKTVDLNRFKTRITEEISKSIGRDVSLRHVSFDFSIVQGVTLEISGLSIMDHPDFSTEPMLYVDSSRLDVDILSFLLKRQVMVSTVELNSLKIHLLRDGQGKINFQELAREKENSPSDPGEAAVSAPKDVVESATKKRQDDFDFNEVMVRTIRITDGTFVFTDLMTDPPVTIPVTEIEFQVSNLSFDAAFPFQLKASLFSDRQNIALNGLARINKEDRQLRIDDLKMRTDLSDISLDRVYDGIPSLKDAGLQNRIEGQVAVDVHQMILGEQGLLVLSSDGRLTDVKAQFKDSPIPIENLNMEFSMTESDAQIKEVTMPVASGEMRVSGRIIDYFTERKYLADLKLTDVQLSELTAALGLPVKLEGQFHADFKVNGLATDEQAIKTSLAGGGVCQVKNGRIVDINILKVVLGKIAFIPDLANQIETNLPEKYKEKLNVRDTILEKLEMDTKVREGAVFINSAELNADGFLVLANGKLDFDQNLSLSADLYIPADLSAGMLAVSGELKYFLDEKKQIHIPLRPYNGKLADFRMYPDVEDLGKEIIRNRGKEELKKVIFKALDLEDQGPETAESQGDGVDGQSPKSKEPTEPQERERRPEEVIIENIFDMIPVFK